MYTLNRQLLKDGFGWGFLLWLFGYILGIVLFAVVPPSLIGWVIMPLGVIFTLWVLIKKVNYKNYLHLAVIWTLIAIIFDYFFLVRLFKPVDGYYKPDVYLYYALTFTLPLLVSKYLTPRS